MVKSYHASPGPHPGKPIDTNDTPCFILPTLKAAQLDLLIRGVEALGSANYGGWQKDEVEMRKLLHSIRRPNPHVTDDDDDRETHEDASARTATR